MIACRRGCAHEALVNELVDRGLWPLAARGCTLEQLAEAKHLPATLLQRYGVETETTGTAPRVRIPFADELGNLVAVRYRLSVADAPRFAWRGGDESRATLYGLPRLREFIQQHGWVLLVRSESDVWTAWKWSIPALGMIGDWRDEWGAWARHRPVDVYVWCQADHGLPAEIIRSLPNVRILFAPPGILDLSHAHLEERDVRALVFRGKEIAPAAEAAQREIEERTRERFAAEALRRGESLLDDPHPLERIAETLAAIGLVGDIKGALVVELAIVSRALAAPVNVFLDGPSAAGKTYFAERVIALHPADAIVEFHASSKRDLVFAGDIRHRILYVPESSGLHRGGIGATFLRSLTWGKRKIVYRMVRMTKAGPVSEEFTQDGPAGLLTTKTGFLDKQQATRLLRVIVPVNRNQIRAVLDEQGRLAEAGDWGQEIPEGVDLSSIVAAHTWIATAGVRTVAIPFGRTLAGLVDHSDVRIQRDFANVLGLICACAMLHQRHRARNAKAQIEATLDDYRIVHALLADALNATSSSVLTPGQRDAVAAVRLLVASHPNGVNFTHVAKHLGITRSSASRRLEKPIALGFVTNDEPNERLDGRLRPVPNPPDERPVLPDPETLRKDVEDAP